MFHCILLPHNTRGGGHPACSFHCVRSPGAKNIQNVVSLCPKRGTFPLFPPPCPSNSKWPEIDENDAECHLHKHCARSKCNGCCTFCKQRGKTSYKYHHGQISFVAQTIDIMQLNPKVTHNTDKHTHTHTHTHTHDLHQIKQGTAKIYGATNDRANPRCSMAKGGISMRGLQVRTCATAATVSCTGMQTGTGNRHHRTLC